MGNQVGVNVISVHMLVWNDFCNDARVLKEAQTLQAAGYSVVVHALDVPGKTPRLEYLADGIEVRRVSSRPFTKRVVPSQPATKNRLSLFRELLSRVWAHLMMFYSVVRSRPKLVHAHDVNMLPTAWAAAKVVGARFIYDAHEVSTSREGYAGVSQLVYCVESQLMPRAHGAITTTDARAKFFARAYGVPRPVVLQNRPRHQVPIRSTRIRDELNLEQPWPIILYQGGVQSGRGLERLIRVAANVPDAYFVFIGGGRLDASLRTIACELGLQERVRFIPTVALAELPSYTASADIGVQPIENTCLNHFTTDSNKLFEYVQAGLPVVASDLPEIRRIVRKHNLGLLVPESNSEALAEALRTLVTDSERREYYADFARKAAPELSWEMQEGLLIGLYRSILD